MEYSFLLPRCGAKNPSLRNHHGTKFPKPDVGHQYIYCEDTNQNTMNKKINERNYPDSPSQILLDPRPDRAALCPEFSKKQPRPEVLEFHPKCTPSLTPGKGDIGSYFNNIDVESRLKNIDYFDTKCANNVYKNDSDCLDCRLSCHRNVFVKDEKVKLPERPRNKCINHTFKNKCPYDASQNNPNVFIRPVEDTAYDYSNHEICDIKCEKIWHNVTTRKSFDPCDCPCLGKKN